jgi:chromatin remodeling complex protein RSC6
MSDNLDNSEHQDDIVTIQFANILQTLAGLRTQVTALQSDIRGVEKTVKKRERVLQKEAAKHKHKGNRKPSGFAKPTAISDKLCKFMNKETGAEVARTEVTQYIISYISEMKLQDPVNRKKIVPNKELKDLLGVETETEVTYFNIQKYMNQHFKKKVPQETPVVV